MSSSFLPRSLLVPLLLFSSFCSDSFLPLLSVPLNVPLSIFVSARFYYADFHTTLHLQLDGTIHSHTIQSNDGGMRKVNSEAKIATSTTSASASSPLNSFAPSSLRFFHPPSSLSAESSGSLFYENPIVFRSPFTDFASTFHFDFYSQTSTSSTSTSASSSTSLETQIPVATVDEFTSTSVPVTTGRKLLSSQFNMDAGSIFSKLRLRIPALMYPNLNATKAHFSSSMPASPNAASSTPFTFPHSPSQSSPPSAPLTADSVISPGLSFVIQSSASPHVTSSSSVFSLRIHETDPSFPSSLPASHALAEPPTGSASISVAYGTFHFTLPVQRVAVQSSASSSHSVKLHYSSTLNRLKVFVNDPVTPLLILPNMTFDSERDYYIGFTGAPIAIRDEKSGSLRGDEVMGVELLDWMFEKRSPGTGTAGAALSTSSVLIDNCDSGFSGSMCKLDDHSNQECLLLSVEGCLTCISSIASCQWCSSNNRCVAAGPTASSYCPVVASSSSPSSASASVTHVKASTLAGPSTIPTATTAPSTSSPSSPLISLPEQCNEAPRFLSAATLSVLLIILASALVGLTSQLWIKSRQHSRLTPHLLSLLFHCILSSLLSIFYTFCMNRILIELTSSASIELILIIGASLLMVSGGIGLQIYVYRECQRVRPKKSETTAPLVMVIGIGMTGILCIMIGLMRIPWLNLAVSPSSPLSSSSSATSSLSSSSFLHFSSLFFRCFLYFCLSASFLFSISYILSDLFRCFTHCTSYMNFALLRSVGQVRLMTVCCCISGVYFGWLYGDVLMKEAMENSNGADVVAGGGGSGHSGRSSWSGLDINRASIDLLLQRENYYSYPLAAFLGGAAAFLTQSAYLFRLLHLDEVRMTGGEEGDEEDMDLEEYKLKRGYDSDGL